MDNVNAGCFNHMWVLVLFVDMIEPRMYILTRKTLSNRFSHITNKPCLTLGNLLVMNSAKKKCGTI